MNAQTIGFGLAAGLMAAILSGLRVTGSPIALIAFFLSPVPIVIASMAFDHRVGLGAAIIGGAVLAFAIHPTDGLEYVLGSGLPAWWLSYLALLARTDGATQEWYPLGRLLAWIAGITAVLVSMTILMIGLDYATYLARFERLIDTFLRFNPGLLQGIPEAARGAAKTQIVAIAAYLVPPITAALIVIVMVLVLWMGAKAVLRVGRLPRPWPDLASVALPQSAAYALLGFFLVSLLDGFVGLIARIFFAAFVCAFGLQGLAVLHKVSHGFSARGVLLVLVYLVTFLFSGWPLVLFAIAGLADLFFRFRDRPSGGAPPPTTPPANSDHRRNPWN